MAQQQLNGTHVGPGFDQVGRKTVSKRMGCDRFGNAATLTRLLAGLFHRVLSDVAAELDLLGRATVCASPLATKRVGLPVALARASHSDLSDLCPARLE